MRDESDAEGDVGGSSAGAQVGAGMAGVTELPGGGAPWDGRCCAGKNAGNDLLDVLTPILLDSTQYDEGQWV